MVKLKARKQLVGFSEADHDEYQGGDEGAVLLQCWIFLPGHLGN